MGREGLGVRGVLGRELMGCRDGGYWKKGRN